MEDGSGEGSRMLCMYVAVVVKEDICEDEILDVEVKAVSCYVGRGLVEVICRCCSVGCWLYRLRYIRGLK